MSRMSLKDQLRALENDDDQEGPKDPEDAYASLDSVRLSKSKRNAGEDDDYLDVGPSRLRNELGTGDQVLLSDKYAGKTVGRRKIFDDDEDEESDDGEELDEEEDDDDDEDGGDDEKGGLNGTEDEGEGHTASEGDDDEEEDEAEEGEGDEDEDVEEEEEAPTAGPSRSIGIAGKRSTDPVKALREARAKDIERGRGIRRQKALFDGILALRITFQKALTSSAALPSPPPLDPSGELDRRKSEALKSLMTLSEELFELRKALILPGTDKDAVQALGKRRRDDIEEEGEGGDLRYLLGSTNESLKLMVAQHDPLISILSKWHSKIQAATVSVTSKAAGTSRFMQGTKGQQSIIEVIQSSLDNSYKSESSFMETEESAYRALLREVIESRGSGAGGGVDLAHLRREKKKKREAERGGSKGRKLRYTVHEKAQHFTVPVPLRNGWHEEQIDELFSSLLGGAGSKGAGSEGATTAAMFGEGAGVNGDGGLVGLGGLKVF